ncbi:hypothetical protein L596_021411 [Steinernema carpocapsae]|uniref:F-box domain-containing protein n=1 Tax=Steinernema carpocapsae TaxID=34508 RepID=A0A4U5MIN5_STECR|nr:hypothetical protein L596_021411 [Steinernema carpocapsae]
MPKLYQHGPILRPRIPGRRNVRPGRRGPPRTPSDAHGMRNPTSTAPRLVYRRSTPVFSTVRVAPEPSDASGEAEGRDAEPEMLIECRGAISSCLIKLLKRGFQDEISQATLDNLTDKVLLQILELVDRETLLEVRTLSQNLSSLPSRIPLSEGPLGPKSEHHAVCSRQLKKLERTQSEELIRSKTMTMAPNKPNASREPQLSKHSVDMAVENTVRSPSPLHPQSSCRSGNNSMIEKASQASSHGTFSS